VCSITIRLVTAVLALAKKDGFGFLNFKNDGCGRRVGLVASIAEGLFLGMAAGAPGVVFPRFQLRFRGKFKGNIWFGHLFSPFITS
jgi:hypothetical protein